MPHIRWLRRESDHPLEPRKNTRFERDHGENGDASRRNEAHALWVGHAPTAIVRMHVTAQSQASLLDPVCERCYFFCMGSFLPRLSGGASVLVSAYLAGVSLLLAGCGGATFQGDGDDAGEGGGGSRGGQGGSGSSGSA